MINMYKHLDTRSKTKILNVWREKFFEVLKTSELGRWVKDEYLHRVARDLAHTVCGESGD